MAAAQVVTKATPEPGLAKGRVTKAQTVTWTSREIVIRTCMHCKTMYRSAGFAWRCEHWHERL